MSSGPDRVSPFLSKTLNETLTVFNVMIRADVANLCRAAAQPHPLCTELIPSNVSSGGGMVGSRTKDFFQQRLGTREGRRLRAVSALLLPARIARQRLDLLNFLFAAECKEAFANPGSDATGPTIARPPAVCVPGASCAVGSIRALCLGENIRERARAKHRQKDAGQEDKQAD